MIVTFGGIMSGQSGISCGMLAAALSCAEYEQKRVFLIQTDFRGSGWEELLLQERRREELKGVGIGAVLRAMRAGALDQEMLNACTVTLQGSRISFLPGNLMGEDFIQPEEEIGLLERLIELAVSDYDMVFIDVGTDLGICDRIMGKREKKDSAEVICLNQNRRVLESWFANSKQIENRYYLIGMYRTDSCYTIRNLRKRYPPLVENTAILPWCTEYQDACSSGGVSRFFAQNAQAQKDEPNYFFFKACREMAAMLAAGKEMNGCGIF